MKIAVLTYWWGDDNYGQLLQCFALQHYLRSIGHDVYLVRYRPINENEVDNIKEASLKDKFGKLIKFLNPYYVFVQRKRIIELNSKEQKLSNENHISNKSRNFDGFRDNYLQVSKYIYTSIDELRNQPPKADIYICGSDQVWHDSLLLKNVAGWYLQFGNKETKRVSYAASIGRDIEDYEEHVFKEYLQRFNAISVREQTACDYCKSIGFDDSKVVCDPSFLLSADYYIKALGVKKDRKPQPYVFFYTLNIRFKEEIFADKIIEESRKYGWKIKSVGSSGYYTARNVIPGVENIPATITEWLQLICNSELVVTTSFHGTAFSILMHRPFVSVLLHGSFSKANDRIIGLLDILGLSSRIASNEDDIINIINSPIDWDEVDKRMHSYSYSGKNFLEHI